MRLKSPFYKAFYILFVASLFVNYSVEHLYKTPFIWNESPNLPVLVHLPTYTWEQGGFLFGFNDTQTYIAESNLAHLREKIKAFDRFYLITEKPFEAPSGYKQSAEQKEVFGYGHFYLFEK